MVAGGKKDDTFNITYVKIKDANTVGNNTVKVTITGTCQLPTLRL